MKTSWLIAVIGASLACAAPALADPAPGAWQPVISNAPAAIGTVSMIGQPVNVTGVLALLSPVDIPAAGSGLLAWDASADTLSWRGGPAVAVNPAVTADYALPEPTGAADLIAVVTGGELPSTDASDTLTVTSAAATGGFGDPDRDTARGAGIFDSDIYIGDGLRGMGEGEVWRSSDGIHWVEAAAANFGQAPFADEHVDSFIVYGGEFYAGTDTGQIWRTTDGSLWTLATSTPSGDPSTAQNITDFAIFDGLLYANESNLGPAGVFDSPDGTGWSDVLTFPASQPQLKYTHDLQIFDGRLFSSVGSYKGLLGAGGGQVWSTPDGTAWTQSGVTGFGNADNTDISGMAVFDGALYAATFNTQQGAQIWRTTDGASWQQVVFDGFGDPSNSVVQHLIVFDNELYAGTENDSEGGEIWRTSDGTDWTLANIPGFGTGEQMRMRALFQDGPYLYAIAGNDCGLAPPGCVEHGWELWRLQSPVATLVLSPLTAPVAAGVAQPFAAEGLDGDDNDLGDLTASTTFSIAPDGSGSAVGASCSGDSCWATAAGTYTVTGTDGSATGTASLTVTAGPPDAAASTVSASPASVPADGVTVSTVTVTAFDAYGNRESSGGATVTVSTTLGSVSGVTVGTADVS